MPSAVIIRRRTKRGERRYGVRVQRQGRQVWVGTFASIAEARKAQAHARASRRTGTMRADAYAEHWLEGYRERRKASSVATAEAALRPFARDFRGVTLDRITQVEAEKWARQNRWAVPVVITLLNAARKAGLTDDNPFAGLARKGRGRRDAAPLTEAEVERLAAAAFFAHGPGYGETMRALVLFLAYSGLRIGEAFALQWDDVDLREARIHVRRRLYGGKLDLPKSGKQRVCVLTPRARDALLAVQRPGERIFNAKRGGQLSQSSLAWYWTPVAARFGRAVAPHELRHFAAHYLYVTLGLPARVVAVQLGHDGPRLVEQLYGHGDVGALEQIDRAFGANVVPLQDPRRRQVSQH